MSVVVQKKLKLFDFFCFLHSNISFELNEFNYAKKYAEKIFNSTQFVKSFFYHKFFVLHFVVKGVQINCYR